MSMPGGVALLLDSCPAGWSSQEEFHARLAAALGERGIPTVTVFSGEPAPVSRRKFEAAGAAVAVLPYHGPSPGYVRSLCGLLEKHAVSLVHLRYYCYFSLLPWLARIAGARSIVLTDANSGEWQPRPIRGTLVRLRTRLATAPVSRAITVSEFVRGRLVSAGVNRDKIVTVHNGVDTRRYRPDAGARARAREAFGVGDGEIAVSTMAVLRPWKHPEVVIEAVAKAARDRSLPVKLLFGGDGPMRADLVKLSAKLGIQDRVVWVGYTRQPWTVYHASDIFAFASEGEAFGYVLAEAMACGVPVVAARSGAIPEIVEHGRSGLLAPANDPRAFADNIAALAGDEALRKRFGAAAARRARRLFDVETAVANTLAVYDSLERQPSGSLRQCVSAPL